MGTLKQEDLGGQCGAHGWFAMENPIRMDDLEIPPFEETSIYWHANITWHVKKLQPESSWSAEATRLKIERLVDVP